MAEDLEERLTMRERLAKGLLGALASQGDDGGNFAFGPPSQAAIDGRFNLEAAIDAILAILREPTKAMIDAGTERHWGTDRGDDDGRDNVPHIWTAMIDAIPQNSPPDRREAAL